MVTVLTKLDGLLSGTLKSKHMQEEATPPVRSQADDLLYGEIPPAAISTQAAFATQVPDEIDVKSGQSMERPKARSGGGNTELLAKLRRIGPQNPVQQEDIITRKAVSDTGKISQNSSILYPVSDDRAREMSSKLDARVNKRRQSPKSSQSIHRESKGHLAYTKHSGAPVPVSYSPASDDSEKENGQESGRLRVRHGDNPRARKAEAIEEIKPESIPYPFYDMFLDKNPFKGLKRIPRVYSRIPEDQQILLDRKDSWFVPRPDGLPSSANLSPGEVEKLTKFIDQQVAQNLSNRKDEPMDVEREHESKRQNDHFASCEEDDGESNVSWSSSDGYDDRPGGGNLDSENVATSGTRHESQKAADHGPTRAEEFLSSEFSGPADEFVEAVQPERASDEEFTSSWFPTTDPGTKHRDCQQSNDVHFSPNSVPDARPQCVEICNASEDEQMDMDDLSGIRIAGGDTTRNLPLSQTQATAAPSLSNAPPKRCREIPAFPSSSPADEEPLELAVPHAIGDEIEEAVADALEVPNTSEKLPSTAVQHEYLIQVEQTPFTNSPLSGELIYLGGSGPSQLANGTKRAHDDISSDLVIPATFNDTNPQERVSDFHKDEFISSDSEPDIGTSTERRVRALQIKRTESADGGKKDNTLAQQQLFEDPESQQRKKARLDLAQNQAPFSIARSSSLNLDPPGREQVAAPSQELLNPPQSSLSPTWRSPASDERRRHEIPPPNKESFIISAGIFSPAHNKTQNGSLKRRQPMPAASAISQETGSIRDAREMARAKRHKFTEGFAFTEDRPEHLGSGTQPGSSTPKQVTPDRTANSVAEQPAVLTTAITNMVQVGQPSSEVSISAVPLPIRTNPVEECTKNMPKEATNATYETPSLNMDSVPSKDGLGLGNPERLCRREAPICASLFDRFKLSYPAYIGNQKDFTTALVYIEWLWKNKYFVLRSMCDDFICVSSDEYREHVQKNRASGSHVMTGWEFYGHRDQDPKFKKQIITRDNLQGAISSLDPEDVEEYRRRFRDKKSRRGHDPSSLSCHNTESEACVTTREDQTRQKSIQMVSSPLDVGMYLESDSTKNHQGTRSRKAFFETPSQLAGAARNHISSTSVNSWHADSVYGSQAKTTRRLPWSENGSAQTWATSNPPSKVRPSTSTPSSRIYHSHSSSIGVHSGCPEPLRQESGSPILGKVADPFSRPIAESVTRAESISSLRDGGLVTSPTVQLDKPTSRRAASMSQAGVYDLEKVEGWLEAQRPDSAVSKRFASFNEIVSKRKRTSGFAFSLSTPRKRFCTKPVKAGTVEPKEPETQAWDV